MLAHCIKLISFLANAPHPTEKAQVAPTVGQSKWDLDLATIQNPFP